MKQELTVFQKAFYRLKDDTKYNGQKHQMVSGAQVGRHTEMLYRSAECIRRTAGLQITCSGRGLWGALLCLSLSGGAPGGSQPFSAAQPTSWPKAGANGRIDRCHHASLQQFSV